MEAKRSKRRVVDEDEEMDQPSLKQTKSMRVPSTNRLEGSDKKKSRKRKISDDTDPGAATKETGKEIKLKRLDIPKVT